MFDWKPPQVGEPTEDDVKVWTVAVGNLPLPPFIPRKVRKAIKFIEEQDGFIGFYPMYPNGTLCLFVTENDAKGARNMMRFKGIEVGNNICEVYIKKEYLEWKLQKK